MTSLRVVTCARDQSLEFTRSDWSIKFSKLFWRVADKHMETFAAKQNLSDEKIPSPTVASDLNQVKKARSLL